MTMPPIASMTHAKTGMRPSDMPGARVRRIPTMSSIALAMAEISMKPIPRSQKSAPTPGEKRALVSGGYMNHPPSGARLAKRDVKKARPPMA